jgi:hypothetical protein
MKRLLSVLFFLTCVISCNFDNRNEVKIRLPEVQPLKLERKVVDVNLYRPTKVFLYNRKLIIYDNVNDSLFKVFDSRDLKYNYTFGSIGQGPNEFVFIHESTINSSDYFEILDKHELCYYDITDSTAFQVFLPKTVVHKT